MPNTTADTQEHEPNWATSRHLRCQIIGYRTSFLSCADLWRLIFSRTIVMLSTLVGGIVATGMTVNLYYAGDPTFYFNLAYILFPMTVLVISMSLASVHVYLDDRIRRLRGKTGYRPITFITALSVFFVSAIPISVLNWFKIVHGGMDTDHVLVVVLLTSGIYVLVSEFLHYIVFSYMATSILGHDHVTQVNGHARCLAEQEMNVPVPFKNTASDTSGLSTSVRKGAQKQDGWADKVCLRIWISGARSSLMSVRELWKIVFSPIVLFLSILIGSAAGIASAVTLRAIGDETYYYLLLFSVAPVVVNILSASMMSAMVYVRVGLRGSQQLPKCVVVPSCVTVFVASLPAISGIYMMKAMFGNLGTEWLIVVLVFVPTFYVIISDFFHFVVFYYIAPTVWGRSHDYGGARPGAEAAPEIVMSPNADANTMAPVLLEIGDLRVARGDILFLEAQGNYLRIVTQTDEFLERFRISEAANLIGENVGVFLHRSRWVTFAGIEYVELVGGQYRVKMLNGEMLSIASTRQQDVFEAFVENRVSILRPPKRLQNG